MLNLKFKYIHLKRRIPTCYLLSSKFILTAMSVILIYFFTMDIILVSKVKHRGSFKPLPSNLQHTGQPVIKNDTHTPISVNEEFDKPHMQDSFWYPLPVKKIMMADPTHYIRSPIAEFVEKKLGFSEHLPFISANGISLFHCVLSGISIKFLIDDSLFWRQFGVVLFQFRNFLDSFDGVIYRAHAKRTTYKSHYGSLGYLVDAFSDVFGGLCLVGSCAIYLLKRPPLKRSLTRCFRLVDDLEDSIDSTNDSIEKNNLQEEQKFFEINEKNSSNSSITNSYNSKQKSFLYKKNYSTSNNTGNNSIFATKSTILASVALLGIRYGLSALIWDRSVHRYEDLLDSEPKSLLHQVCLNKKIQDQFT